MTEKTKQTKWGSGGPLRPPLRRGGARFARTTAPLNSKCQAGAALGESGAGGGYRAGSSSMENPTNFSNECDEGLQICAGMERRHLIR